MLQHSIHALLVLCSAGTGFPVQAFVFVFSFKEKKLFLKNKRKYEITKYLNFLTFKVDDYRCFEIMTDVIFCVYFTLCINKVHHDSNQFRFSF